MTNILSLFSLAEGEGFEPPKVINLNGFQDRRNQPLCHPSHGVFWQGGRDSNPQPTVLETATLPIELPPYLFFTVSNQINPIEPAGSHACGAQPSSRISHQTYSTISEILPAPIVRLPSRIAKRCVFSIATGAIRVISIVMLSPGITISTPSGNITVPVTSVVRK